jgi:hypothetical protein
MTMSMAPATSIEWAVWYDDGSSFSSADGAPWEAPRWGVLCIAAYSGQHGRMIWHATDYYCWAGEWISCDATGLIDYLANRPGPEKTVLMGRHVAPDTFYRVYEIANSDPRLPPRSSEDHLEHRRPNL